MALKKILILPTFAFGAIAYFNLALGNVFHAHLWAFLCTLVTISFFPIFVNQEEKFTPLFQVFSSLFAFVIFASAFISFDMNQIGGYSQVELFGYSLFLGIILTATLTAFRGENG